MLFRRVALAVAIVATAMFSHSGVHALDLAEARSGGAVLAEALDLGEAGQWGQAQAIANRSSDPVLRDIVLWRKLRAGQGTVLEYQGFVSRRGTWPGQEILAKVVIGERAPPKPDRLAGRAAKNWQEFRRLYKRKRYDDAANLLASITGDAANLGHPEVWGHRRQVLARRAARAGQAQLAYLLASQHHMTSDDGYTFSDLEWIAGWVALRKLRDPRRALEHFHKFNASVATPISLGRGGYWLGRAYEAQGDPASASEWYRAGARYQTSFYGQLAAAKLDAPGDINLVSGSLPDWSKSPVMRSDDVRAGVLLHYAGEASLAFQVFSHLGKRIEGGAALGALAQLGLELGQPHYAVRIAKHAARKGVILYPAYYPVTGLAGYATKIEPALAMAIARQETELNPRAISPAGARGLMQLMPRTAQKVAGWIGEDYSRNRLIDDWQYNARLGQTYLARRIQQFSGSYVLAAAAYNAGAGRVDQWIDRYGDPRMQHVNMIDWIETIPFSETRNYVQRVMEGLYVYRTRLTGEAGPMTIREDLSRGVRG